MKKVLDQTNREYLSSLIPKDIPDWKASWEEGYRIGQGIEIMETPFMKKYGVRSDAEYRLQQAAKGKLTWQINMGLATIDIRIAALKEAEKFNEETGLNISFAHQLPKTIVGTPKDKREGIPVALGYDLNEPEDWVRITMASTIQVVFADDHLGYPNAVETTINSLRAGSMYQGMFGMFHQVAPGCPDEVWNMNENVKALGIVAAKYDDRVIVNSNQDDSLPAYCMDLASYLAWAKWERYVVTDLCKARYAFSFGILPAILYTKRQCGLRPATPSGKTISRVLSSYTLTQWITGLTIFTQITDSRFLRLLWLCFWKESSRQGLHSFPYLYLKRWQYLRLKRCWI